jgi:hypothetical protein
MNIIKRIIKTMMTKETIGNVSANMKTRLITANDITVIIDFIKRSFILIFLVFKSVNVPPALLSAELL